MFKEKTIYNKVLVAIDLSDHSHMPMEKAVNFSKHYGAQLDVIHVISMAIPYYSYSFSTEIQDAVYADAKQHFVKFCAEYDIKKENQHLLVGSPKLQIIDLVEKLNVDLLIVGSHGEQHILPVTFGSTANAIIAKAKCDVLTVTIHPFTQQHVKEKSASKEYSELAG